MRCKPQEEGHDQDYLKALRVELHDIWCGPRLRTLIVNSMPRTHAAPPFGRAGPQHSSTTKDAAPAPCAARRRFQAWLVGIFVDCRHTKKTPCNEGHVTNSPRAKFPRACDASELLFRPVVATPAKGVSDRQGTACMCASRQPEHRRFRVLYAKQGPKKRKTWHDGFLRVTGAYGGSVRLSLSSEAGLVLEEEVKRVVWIITFGILPHLIHKILEATQSRERHCNYASRVESVAS
eukprot:5348752-Pleurochrysis_carterae.AAC.11